MNRTFLIKMMQAKQLQYEALKEVMPEKLADRMSKLEDELFTIGKEFMMETMSAAAEGNASEGKEKEAASRIRKVTIE